MSNVQSGRFSAQLPDSGAVVLLIGMRINQPWRLGRWIPVFVAMGKMIAELRRNPSLGLLSAPRSYLSGRVILVVQYWRDFESLESYARNAELTHLGAWRTFNQRARDNSAVGVWHETILVNQDSCESVYVNMPLFGLAGATQSVAARLVGNSAALRLKVRDADEPPVEP